MIIAGILYSSVPMVEAIVTGTVYSSGCLQCVHRGGCRLYLFSSPETKAKVEIL